MTIEKVLTDGVRIVEENVKYGTPYTLSLLQLHQRRKKLKVNGYKNLSREIRD